jgi:Tfp pilus assembly protein PilP
MQKKEKVFWMSMLTTVSLGMTTFADELPNPFAPQFRLKPAAPVVAPDASSSDRQKMIPQSQAYTVAQYQLSGTLVSDKGSIAFVSTRSGATYTLKIGDKLGKHEAVLEEVGVDHATFNENDIKVTVKVGNAL